ncbi:MAG: hypothetical protein AAF990_14300 [Bacteroidota bacterium]
MKLVQRLLFITSIWLLSFGSAAAQVVIRPISPTTPFFNIDQLLKFQLINTTNQDFSGVVQIQIEDQYAKSILQIHSLPMELPAGASMNQQNIQWEGGVRLSENQFARWLAQSGGLPNGQYIYCYRFVDTQSGRNLGNYCIENASFDFRLPELIYPFDGEKLKTAFPVLSWRPPVPLRGNALNYSLRLVELLEGQSPISAVNSNLPLFDKRRLRTLSMPYPVSAIPLEMDKQYVWQVTAYWRDIEIGKTDIWQFSLAEEAIPQEAPPLAESYRFVRRKLNGKAYLFSDKLHFAFDNRANEKVLAYRIYAKGNQQEELANLPAISLSPGLNQIDVPIDKKLNLKKERNYVLEIKDAYQTSHYLEFKYVPNKK